MESELETGAYAAVIVEGIQGVGGIQMPDTGFLQSMRELCTSTGTLMIVDEVQSGYGRTGKFFAHQHAGVLPDIITMAKGMGNGFPIGGLLISPKIKARKGMLGTTFGRKSFWLVPLLWQYWRLYNKNIWSIMLPAWGNI